MYGYIGWWIIGFGGLLFGVFHASVMGVVALLAKLGWMTENDARGMYASLPVKLAEAALATVLAFKSMDWFRM